MFARSLLAKGQPVKFIWSKKWGSAFFHDTMSRDRYREILKFIRFDIRSTRSQCLMTDQFALVSTMWNQFIENCKASYRPGENITIDEQLFPTKARCPFTKYNASKPDKILIKFWLAVDSKKNIFIEWISLHRKR